jgi:uncharacterized protein DUF1552
MYLSRKHLPRRTVLKGLGVSIALPFLDAMSPAATAWVRDDASARRLRLVAMEIVHGAAGATAFGAKKNMWTPAAAGSAFDLTPTALAPLEPYRDYLTLVSNTDCRNAEAFTPPEIGGDHFRSAAVFLTQSHPHQTQGSDVHAGTSLDQIYAKAAGQDTPIPSMQLCIESIDQSGGCFYGYSCAYTDSISWGSPTEPLPMIRDPRAVFDQLFGVGATPEARGRRRRKDKSLLDWVMASADAMRSSVGAGDRARLDDYLDNVREIERRIERVEAHNSSGEARDLPSAPIGVPDSYADHVRLMFDLQALAFAADITRVFALKLSRDVSNRVFTEAGATTGFHIASHHNEREDRITDFAKINRYHVSLLPYFLEKLKQIPDGDGSVLDHSLIVYGSPMGNPNVHNHKRCPLFFLGHAGGRLKGNLHIKADDGTPMANAMLAGLQSVGLDISTFGDSTAALDLNTVRS